MIFPSRRRTDPEKIREDPDPEPDKFDPDKKNRARKIEGVMGVPYDVNSEATNKNRDPGTRDLEVL